MKKKSSLHNWSIVDRGGWYILLGTVLDDPRFEPGTEVQTSMLLNINLEKGVAETQNTIYELH